MAVAVPFMPVRYDVTTLAWPTAQGTDAVSAPLAAYSPVRLDIEVPCAAARELDARSTDPAVLVSTNAPSSEYGKLTGLLLQVHDGQVALVVRGQQLGSAVLPDSECSISVHSDGHRTFAAVGDRTLAQVNDDIRPQLTGIYSDLDERIDNVRDVSFAAEVDNRYASSATLLKILVIVLAVLGFLGSLLALRRYDKSAGRRPPRIASPGWWRPTARDVVVVSVLAVWWLIGAMTADDGYFLEMARARSDIGYVSDFYRWFAVAVAPIGWFVELYAQWVQISTATPWVRLPAFAMGLVSWLLISRMMLPRLGQRVRRSRAAGWAAAAVFLAAWMPYNNGLRPEPVVVVFSLLAFCAVERALATRRLVPAALGLVAAALAVATNPHGVVAVLPFIAALKPLLRLLIERARQFGWVPVLAPVAACSLVILTVAFADQTLQSTMDATKLRTEIGPSLKWYEELSRYTLLFSQVPDGSLTRRFPVLLMMLCLATCVVVLLRKGQIRGAALGPSRRLLAVAALYFVALAFTPTKHTHHFGVLAAVCGSVAALTALATSSTVLRSRRNRSFFFAGLMVVLAFAFTGTNAWWYVSGWGVPWFDKSPSINGYEASTFLLVIAGIALIVGCVEHLRLDEHRPDAAQEDSGRALRLGTAPLSLVCALLMAAEVGSLTKVIQEQSGSYSLGQDNVKQLVGSSCGLSDYVNVETNPSAGVLEVSPSQPATAAPGTRLPKKLHDETPDEYLLARETGFQRPGLPPANDAAKTGGSDWTPPYRFGTDRAPVWGSYDPAGVGTGQLRTSWYEIPERVTSGEVPLVLSLAGSERGANSVVVEFGRDTPEGFELLHRHPVIQDEAPQWRDHRITVGSAADGATKMRIIANDQAIGVNGWVAVSAPRAPQLTRMTDVVGDAPTFVEWTAALVHPCLKMTNIHDGIAEVPHYRVAGGGEVRSVGQGWSSPDAGGPFGWLTVATSMSEMPTYLKNDLQRDWGSLYAVHPYDPDALPAEAAKQVRTETHWGLWTPGPLTKPIHLPGDVPNSNDRADVPLFDEDMADEQTR
ncbi:arabinosyltransferase domain-containing protein [Saccharopolyspora sp. NPDC002376]